ncbi:MAG: hypothetical protein KKH94_10445, partial [Candidatus Omnitrophica bacterium]|nr:hypothetical protein [Candidatus Omnitrophota bacterium]
MKKNNQTYIKILLVIAVSVTLIIVARWINLNGFVQGVASIPAACALLAALFQILRDQFNYEKEEELQKKQDFFNLGITSHMAQVAFDKHVEFCEEYMKELHETVSTLFERGPTDKVMKHVSNFYELKHKYSL